MDMYFPCSSLAKEGRFLNIIGGGATFRTFSCESSGIMSVMNKKQRKDLVLALGILVVITIVLALVATLSG